MDSASQKKSCLYDKLVNEMNHLHREDQLSLGLRNELENIPLDARKEIANRLNRVKNGSLYRACREGQLEIAKYLIRTCGADIEQKGTCKYVIYEEDGLIHMETPLSCAATEGNLSIVKLLIQSGADVNAVSNRGFTPIMMACSMNNFQVVKYLVRYGADINIQAYKGETCLMESMPSVKLCRFLLKNGADVNAKNIRNETILHYEIKQNGSLKKVKLLLKYGADYTTKCRDGDDALQAACLKESTEIFEYLISKKRYSPEKIANAHELMGTSLMEQHPNITVGLYLWKKALKIRDKNGLHPKQPVMSLHEKYWNLREFETLDELMAMSEDLDKIKVQRLLISERILGTDHWATTERLLGEGGVYAHFAMRHQRCIDLLRCALQVRIENGTVLHSNTFYTAQALLKTMLEFHSESVKKNIDNSEQRFHDIVEIYKLLCENIVEMVPNLLPLYGERLARSGKIVRCITHLIYLIIETAKTKSNKELVTNLLKTMIGSNIKCFFTGDSILHLSVSLLYTPIADRLFYTPLPIFPNVNVSKHLLECGANVHVKNENGFTPLLKALWHRSYSPQVVKLLLDFGAHLDAPDADGTTPWDVIKNLRTDNVDFADISLINYTSLQCLCATQIVKNNISYAGHLPKTLESFVRLHDATKPN